MGSQQIAINFSFTRKNPNKIVDYHHRTLKKGHFSSNMLTFKNSVVTILSLLFSFYLISMKTSSVPRPSMRMALGGSLVNLSHLYLSKCVYSFDTNIKFLPVVHNWRWLCSSGDTQQCLETCSCHNRVWGCHWNANKQLKIYRTIPTTKITQSKTAIVTSLWILFKFNLRNRWGHIVKLTKSNSFCSDWA